MFNIFKKEEPNIIFWSKIGGLEKIIPIKKAFNYTPEWFKNLKSHPEQYGNNFVGTVKACPSFVDYFKNAYIVPLWCDLKINIDDSGKYTWHSPSKEFTFNHHSPEQFANWLPEHQQKNIKLILKADCPWRCKTSKGYILMQQPLYYHFNDLFEVLPGFIDTDYYHEINQQIVFKKTGEFFIPRGTPLAMYYVIKRENLKFHCVNYDDPLIKNYKNYEVSTGGNNKVDFNKTIFTKAYLEFRKKWLSSDKS